MRTETTTVEGKLYKVALLESYADQLETTEIPLSELKEAVSSTHHYWEDKKGQILGPFQLLEDWQAAQKNPDWSQHIDTILRADTSDPIWIAPDGHVFNGVHRLTRAFLDNHEKIKAKKFPRLPKEAEAD